MKRLIYFVASALAILTPSSVFARRLFQPPTSNEQRAAFCETMEDVQPADNFCCEIEWDDICERRAIPDCLADPGGCGYLYRFNLDLLSQRG